MARSAAMSREAAWRLCQRIEGPAVVRELESHLVGEEREPEPDPVLIGVVVRVVRDVGQDLLGHEAQIQDGLLANGRAPEGVLDGVEAAAQLPRPDPELPFHRSATAPEGLHVLDVPDEGEP